jgi:16S rRNA A1518/A1519 N6-dimethyltransferase RsmA/KsgA/DIM1 with predicted DNA glycosylase/AP lyase activity
MLATWQQVAEIGSGAGKYTRTVLETSRAIVHCLDVSHDFLSILVRELGGFVEAGRVRPVLLKKPTPR